MKELLDDLPFNSYNDLFNAVKEGKAKIKLGRSDCSQIASLKHPYFSVLGLYIGFVITTIFLIYFSVIWNNYWLLLLIPVNFILSSMIVYFSKIKIIAWSVLFLDLFVFKLPNFVPIICLNIICIHFFYNIWWNIIYKQTISELQCNEDAFLWSWHRCGLSIEDCYGNVYSKFNKIIRNENNTNLDKNVELSNIVMKGLNVESIDEAIEKTYYFYKEQGIDVERVKIDNENKFKTLAELVMLGLSTNNINEAIQETKEFYNNQDSKEEKYKYDRVILDLMKESNLSYKICKDICKIVIEFKNGNTENGYTNINSQLIPDLKEEGNIANVGIAFGMLIDDVALSKEESIEYSQKVIKEIVSKGNLEKSI